MYIQGDLVKADVDMRTSYFDEHGNLVWAQNTRIYLNNKYSVIEEKFRPNKDYLVYYPQINGMEDRILQERVNKKLNELSKVKEIDENTQLDYNYAASFLGEFFKKDLLVLEISGYVKILSDIIGKQIKTDPHYSYIFPDTYKGIRENQPFYINNNALYIYFESYEIAPYAAGFTNFKILYSQIKEIIDEEGSFWKAFNDVSKDTQITRKTIVMKIKCNNQNKRR